MAWQEEGGDPQLPEPTQHEHALARFSEMQSPDPNTFLREAWPHLDPGQRELVQVMLAPRVEGGGPQSQPNPEPDPPPPPSGGVPGSIFGPPTVVKRDPAPSQYMTHGGITRGRPTSERLGVEPEMGGMPQPENRMYETGDELMHSALRGLPLAFQAWGNTKINRPEISAHNGQWAYGQPQNSGGWYEPGQDTVNVPRGNDYGMTPWGPGTHQRGAEVARHELVHRAQFRHPSYAFDARGGWPEFMKALTADAHALQQPAADKLRGEITRFSLAGDTAHMWSAAAEAYMQGIRPPNLARYFAALDKPLPKETR